MSFMVEFFASTHVSPAYDMWNGSDEWGVDTGEPPPQKYPAAHGPVGAVRPKVSQYSPATHGEQSSTPRRLPTALYVPGGHKYSVEKRVIGGQYDPAGQGDGTLVFDSQ